MALDLTEDLTARPVSSPYPALALFAVVAGSLALAGAALPAAAVFALAFWYAAANAHRIPGLLVGALAVLTLFGDRLIWATGIGGGSGILRIGSVGLVAVAAAAFIANAKTQPALGHAVRFGAPAALFLGLGVALPLIGLLAGYPARTLLATLPPLLIGAALTFGVLLARDGDRDAHLQRLMLAVAWGGAAFGLLQFLYINGVGVPLGEQITAWDRSITATYDILLLRGRTIGPYLNPNVFAAVGGFTLLYALFGRGAWRGRLAVALPGAIMVVLGQSRGVALAIAIALVVHLATSSGRKPRGSTIAAVSAAFVVVAGALALIARWFPAFWTTTIVRFTSGFEALAGGGAAADANVAGRLTFWRGAWELLLERPLGTFGPPEALLGTAADSDFVRLALQGGLLYVGTFVLLLVWLLFTGHRTPSAAATRSIAVYIATLALTQIPTAYTGVSILFGVILGYHVASLAEEPVAESPPEATAVRRDVPNPAAV